MSSGKPRSWRFGGPGRPPVTASTLRGGEFQISMELSWPALVWNDGRCWCYLHDLEVVALRRIMARLRETELQRSQPHGLFRY
jgi:hypothetical protein